MSTPWGTSPYATPTPVIDSVMRNPATTPTPVPIPGLMPLPFQQFMAPPAPVPYLGVPPQFMAPPAPVPYLGVPSQFMAPPAPVPYLGLPPQFMAPPAPLPYLGVPSQGFPQLGMPPAQALGLDMQTTPWPIAGLGRLTVSPVITMLLSQVGLREAVSRIGDEALKQRVTTSVNEAIDRTIESVSGLTLHPWFGPGAQFMIYPIAAQLALIAHRYPDGDVRNALLNIAGQILQKSIAPTGEGAGRHK
ncbi:MAG: hypothetical protein ACLQUY_23660 [Ktedonobacterales bacterium]